MKEPVSQNENVQEDRTERSTRAAARAALQQILKWAKALNTPPENVEN